MLEVLTVIVIIAVLATVALPVVDSMRARAEKIKCIANLRSLHVAANLYVQQHGHWPQIVPRLIVTDIKEYAKQWQGALAPFGLREQNWVCPTVQRAMANPDLGDPRNRRIDYISTPFDDKQFTPYKWAAQPWFAEKGSHDDGNLMIFADGSVRSLGDMVRANRGGGGAPAKPHKHTAPETLSIAATIADAVEGRPEGIFTVTRTGKTDTAVTVKYTIGGTATNNVDYASIEREVTIPAGSNSAKIHIAALQDAAREDPETVIVTLLSSSGGYKVGTERTATITIHDAESN